MAWQLCCRSCTSRDALIITMRRQRLRAEVLRLRARIAKRVVRSTRPLCKASPFARSCCICSWWDTPSNAERSNLWKSIDRRVEQLFQLAHYLKRLPLATRGPSMARVKPERSTEVLLPGRRARCPTVPSQAVDRLCRSTPRYTSGRSPVRDQCMGQNVERFSLAGPRLNVLRVDLECLIVTLDRLCKAALALSSATPL